MLARKSIPAEIKIQSKSTEDTLTKHIASPASVCIFNRGTTALDRFSQLLNPGPKDQVRDNWLSRKPLLQY